jgi:hypothetical protein
MLLSDIVAAEQNLYTKFPPNNAFLLGATGAAGGSRGDFRRFTFVIGARPVQSGEHMHKLLVAAAAAASVGLASLAAPAPLRRRRRNLWRHPRRGHRRHRHRQRSAAARLLSAAPAGLLSPAPAGLLSTAGGRSPLSASANRLLPGPADCVCPTGTGLPLGTAPSLGRGLRLPDADRAGLPLIVVCCAQLHRPASTKPAGLFLRQARPHRRDGPCDNVA